ncbi:Ig-like domain-containing protein, partial [Acinetobacter sp. YH12023]|uniref:Ig-like domain-containing protein n=1 Tax=Acinetobacter sp. YH12023 TaxID=2601041 RepID=UPI0015D26424
MANVQVVSKETHVVLQQSSESRILLTENSVVKIEVSKNMVESITRDGNSAVVKLKNGEIIIIESYFDDSVGAHSLVFEGDDGLYWVQFTDESGNILSNIIYNPLEDITPLLYSNTIDGISPWAIGAGLLGGIAAGIESLSEDKKNNKDLNSGTDTTAPSAPTDVVISEDGTTVTGKGEPGSTFKIKDKDGTVIGTGTVDSAGNFEVELKDPLTNGEKVDVTLTDKAGNESEPTEATAPDTTAPAAPTDVAVSEDGTTVTGKGEPGSTVEIKDQDGNVIGTGTVDSNGDFSVELEEPLTNGETIEATVTDPAGNESEPTEATAPDTTAPVVSDVVATPNEDGTATVTGKTEPGATVVIKDPAGNPVPVTVNPDGTFTATVPAPAPEG